MTRLLPLGARCRHCRRGEPGPGTISCGAQGATVFSCIKLGLGFKNSYIPASGTHPNRNPRGRKPATKLQSLGPARPMSGGRRATRDARERGMSLRSRDEWYDYDVRVNHTSSADERYSHCWYGSNSHCDRLHDGSRIVTTCQILCCPVLCGWQKATSALRALWSRLFLLPKHFLHCSVIDLFCLSHLLLPSVSCRRCLCWH